MEGKGRETKGEGSEGGGILLERRVARQMWVGELLDRVEVSRLQIDTIRAIVTVRPSRDQRQSAGARCATLNRINRVYIR